MEPQKILITGSEGLIGKLLRDSLREDKHEFVLIDKKTGTDILTSDFSNYFKEVESVIHLAGCAGPNISQREMEENILMTVRVAHAAADNNITRIVYSSSIHVYDFSNRYFKHENIDTSTPLKVHSNPEYYKDDSEKKVANYSLSKILSEKILESFYQQFGISILNLRLGAVTHNNQPAQIPWGNATFLSHEDLREIIKKGLTFNGYRSLVCISENNENFINRGSLEEFLKE